MINGEIYVPEFTLSWWYENYTRDAFLLKYSWKNYVYCLFILKSIIAIKTHQVANHGFNTHINLMGTHWIKKMRCGKRTKDNWKEKRAQEQASHSASCKATCAPAVPSFSATSFSTLGPSAVPPTADSSVSCSEPSHSWMDQSHSHASLTHGSPDNILSNLFYNICQAGNYNFFTLSQNSGKPSTITFFLISLLISLLPLTPFLEKNNCPSMTWDSQ